MAFYKRKTDNFRFSPELRGRSKKPITLSSSTPSVYLNSILGQFVFDSLAVIAFYRFTSGFPDTSGHSTSSKPRPIRSLTLKLYPERKIFLKNYAQFSAYSRTNIRHARKNPVTIEITKKNCEPKS